MTLLVIADEDSTVPLTTDVRADALISCGDLSDSTILQCAKASACRQILAVRGNHDSSAQFRAPIIDLHMRTFASHGVTFGGFCGAWRYKPRGNYLYDQTEVSEALAGFPAVDIFVAHNSPRGIHDREDDVHLGFDAFVSYIERAQPRLFLHGHQHVQAETQLGITRVIGTYGHRVLDVPSQVA